MSLISLAGRPWCTALREPSAHRSSISSSSGAAAPTAGSGSRSTSITKLSESGATYFPGPYGDGGGSLGRIERSTAPIVDYRPGLRSPVLAWNESARFDSRPFRGAGGSTAPARAPQHLGAGGSCRVLEVRSDAAIDRSTPRIFSAQGLKLVRAWAICE